MNSASFIQIFFLAFTLFAYTTALDISVPSSPISGVPTTVTWTSVDDNDPAMFDLRFVVNNTDVGLAIANVAVGENTSGAVNVTFPEAGPYVLMAVTGSWPEYIQVGKSNQVTVVQAPANSGTTSTPTPTASTGQLRGTASPTSTSSPISASESHSGSILDNPIKRAVIIAVSTLAVLFFLLIVAIIGFVLHRRKVKEADERKRWTFHQDLMVQQRDNSVTPGSSVIKISRGESPPRVELDLDLERGVDAGQEQRRGLPAVPFVMRSPKGPRPKPTMQYPFVSAGNAGSDLGRDG
jgi:hypothetical protein